MKIYGEYRDIHIWEFPSTKTFIRLKNNFRQQLIKRATKKKGSEYKLTKYINNKNKFKRKLHRGLFYRWKKGHIHYKGKYKKANIPLWALIELSKVVSENENKENKIMVEIEKMVKLLDKPKTIKKLVELLNIDNSSVREHLWTLEKNKKVFRSGNLGRYILWKSR